MPKLYRYRLHQLKNAYRKAFRREPEIERAETEEAARRVIAFLEQELQRAGIAVPGNDHRTHAQRRT